MARLNRQAFNPFGILFQTIVGCVFAVLLGVASLRSSPLLVLALLTAAFFAYIALRRPEIALLGILVATSSVVSENQLPLVSVGISLHISDFLLLGLFGVMFVRWLVDPDFHLVHTPLDRPLLTFYGVTLLSTLIAVGQNTVEIEVARRAIRILTYYLTFFVVTNLVRERRQINLLVSGLLTLATLVAAAMVVQFLLGDAVKLLPGRVEALNTQGNMYEDVTRILPPGWSVILIMFVVNLCMLVMEEFGPNALWRFFQVGIMGLALILTFLRSYWASLIIVVILLVFLFRGSDRQRFIRGGLVVLCSAALILILMLTQTESRATRLISASTERLSTLGKSGTFQGDDGSLNWRLIENGYALSTIASHPWLGLGMGFTYRPWDFRSDSPDGSLVGLDFRTFIHNGHLWILLQAGLLGYLAFLWLSLTFMWRGFCHWRSIMIVRFKSVVLGFALVYLAIMIAAVVNSTFNEWYWTPVIGIMMGIGERILAEFGEEESFV